MGLDSPDILAHTSAYVSILLITILCNLKSRSAVAKGNALTKKCRDATDSQKS